MASESKSQGQGELDFGLKLAPGEKLWPQTINIDEQSYETDVLAGALDAVASWAHNTAESKGFYDPEQDFSQPTLALMLHEEVSEVTRALRMGNPQSQKIPAHSAVEEELADIVLRSFAYAKVHGYDIASAIISKGLYNDERPLLHGGKKF